MTAAAFFRVYPAVGTCIYRLNCSSGFVTGVDRAADPVIEGWRLTWLAIEERVTALITVTEEPVVTQGVVDDMHESVGGLVAGVIGA